jgi:GT2 family glycosyltransferase
MIHVIIAVHNRLNLTLNCLNSLRRQKKSEKLNIIVIDDGSTDGTSQYLKKNYPSITILKGNGFLFSAGCFQLGIEYILKISKSNDWVLLVSNDSELSPNAISELVHLSKSKNRKILAGALAVSLKDKKTIIRSGTIVQSWFFNKTKHIYEDLRIDQINNRDSIKVDFIPGRCLLHPIEMFEQVGNYDSETFKHYGNDEEFAIRAKKNGYLSYLCPLSLTYVMPNKEIVTAKLSIKFFFHTFFSERSSVNVVDKFKLTMKIVPLYAKVSFFFIAVVKSLYYFLKNISRK